MAHNDPTKQRSFYQYSDVKGLAPKDFAPPRGNDRLRDSFVAWRMEEKGLSREQALNTVITEEEFNQVKQSEEPLENPADPNKNKIENNSNYKYNLNKQLLIAFISIILLLLPSYYIVYSYSIQNN